MSYEDYILQHRTEMNLRSDFVTAAFEEFARLQSDQKVFFEGQEKFPQVIFFKNFFLSFGLHEIAYLSYRSNQTHVMVYPNGKLFDPTSLDAYGDDTRGVALEPEAIIR